MSNLDPSGLNYALPDDQITRQFSSTNRISPHQQIIHPSVALPSINVPTPSNLMSMVSPQSVTSPPVSEHEKGRCEYLIQRLQEYGYPVVPLLSIADESVRSSVTACLGQLLGDKLKVQRRLEESMVQLDTMTTQFNNATRKTNELKQLLTQNARKLQEQETKQQIIDKEWKEREKALKLKLQNLDKTYTTVLRRDSQYKHEVRKWERTCGDLQDKLQKALMNKSMSGGMSIEWLPLKPTNAPILHRPRRTIPPPTTSVPLVSPLDAAGLSGASLETLSSLLQHTDFSSSSTPAHTRIPLLSPSSYSNFTARSTKPVQAVPLDLNESGESQLDDSLSPMNATTTTTTTTPLNHTNMKNEIFTYHSDQFYNNRDTTEYLEDLSMTHTINDPFSRLHSQIASESFGVFTTPSDTFHIQSQVSTHNTNSFSTTTPTTITITTPTNIDSSRGDRECMMRNSSSDSKVCNGIDPSSPKRSDILMSSTSVGRSTSLSSTNSLSSTHKFIDHNHTTTTTYSSSQHLPALPDVDTPITSAGLVSTGSNEFNIDEQHIDVDGHIHRQPSNTNTDVSVQLGRISTQSQQSDNSQQRRRWDIQSNPQFTIANLKPQEE